MANGNRDFTIDMRMRADFDAARKEIRDTGKDLDDLGAKANAAASSTSRGGAGGGDQANARAQQAYLQASQQTQAAIAAEIGMIGQLQERLSGSASSWEDLADTEAMLDKSMAKGLITAEEYDDALASLDKQQTALERSTTQQGKALDGTLARYDRAGAQLQKLAQDEVRLKAAVDQGRISREQYNKAMANLSAQRASLQGLKQQAGLMRGMSLQTAATQRDLSQLAIYSARGDWQLAGNQILQMGTRAGIASKLFSGLGLSVGVAGVAVAAIGTAAFQSYTEMRALDTAIISTGNSAGITTGQLLEMRNEAAASTGEYGKAQQAALLFVQSGQASAAALEDMISAAVNMSELTGKSIEQTTSEILQLAKAPVPGLIELDKRYNFLTVSTLEQVRALVDQGREQDAVRVGVAALASVHQDRVQQMQDGAAGLAAAWGEAKRSFNSYWNDFKIFVNAAWNPTLDNEIAMLENRLASPDAGENYKRSAKVRLDALRLQKGAMDELAAGTAFANDLRKEGVEAYNRIADGAKNASTNSEKLGAATKQLTADFHRLREDSPDSGLLADVLFGADGSVKGGAFDKQLKALREQFKDRSTGGGSKRSGKTDAQQAEESAKRELDNLAKQSQMLGELEDGERKVSEAARIRYEVEEGAFKNASSGTKEALQDYAQLVDGEQQRVDAAKEYVQVQLEIARLQGRPVPPELDQEAKKLQELAQYYDNLGKAAEASEVRRLLSMRGASQELGQLQTQYDQLLGTIDLAQQRIQLSAQTGLITEAEARRQIVQLYKDQGSELDVLIQKMEALAIATGNEQALQGIQRMKFELEQMRMNTDLLQQSLASTFEGSFSTALQALATNTASLAEAGRQFITDMVAGMARFAAEQLAAIARAKLMQLLSKAGDKGEGGDQGAAKTVTAAAALAGAGIIVSGGAAAVSAAAKELAAAATALAFANSIGGFADGGYTGPGSKYQYAGAVHAGEFVHRQEVVRQPGALPFLRAFNREGMAAIDRWKGYAAGGLVTPPLRVSAPRLRAGDVSDRTGPAVSNHLKMMSFFDMDLLAQEIAKTPHMEKAVVHYAASNGNAIKAEW